MKVLMIIWFVSGYAGGMTSQIVTIEQCESIKSKVESSHILGGKSVLCTPLETQGEISNE